jgi:hypothetical protein
MGSDDGNCRRNSPHYGPVRSLVHRILIRCSVHSWEGGLAVKFIAAMLTSTARVWRPLSSISRWRIAKVSHPDGAWVGVAGLILALFSVQQTVIIFRELFVKKVEPTKLEDSPRQSK